MICIVGLIGGWIERHGRDRAPHEQDLVQWFSAEIFWAFGEWKPIQEECFKLDADLNKKG